MAPLKGFNLLLAFLLELVAVVGFACLSFLLPINPIFQVIASVLLLVGVVVFWGQFMAPKAPRRVDLVAYYIIKSVIYCAAAVTIFHFYSLTPALIFLIIAVINEATLYSHTRAIKA
ncbi:MAG TPA: YrdB family protein [Candidatus Saccharimonadales bacterium]|nr:YrdB family protein [Candidatus Saccharimonadales bacterium]